MTDTDQIYDSQGNALVTDEKAYQIKDKQPASTPQHEEILDSHGNKLVTDLAAYGIQQDKQPSRRKGRLGQSRKVQPSQQTQSPQQSTQGVEKTQQDFEPNQVPNLNTQEAKKQGKFIFKQII